MAEKYKIPVAIVLFMLVLVLYLSSWEESEKVLVPVPVPFPVENTPNLRMEKNSNTFDDVRHVGMISIPTDGTAFGELKLTKGGNEKITFNDTSDLRKWSESRNFVSNVSIDLHETFLPNLTQVDENLNIKKAVTGAAGESKWSKSGKDKVTIFDNITYQLPSSSDTHIPQKPCIKQIQLWSRPKFTFPEAEYDCLEEHCKARYVHSNSYDKLKTSHAVILHHKGSWKWEDIARYRPDGQLWIYMSKESPIHSRRMVSEDPKHLAFNLSMSYHTESDIVIPYGRYIEGKPEIPADDNKNWATGKTRLIAWMASNCGISSWRRTPFVRSLERLIEVDTYGACGRLKCPRDEKCDKILSSHKFYLALENSECQDYITEKFWKNSFTHNSVPIVYGTIRTDYEKVAPPNSFIHLSDFPNMTSLVDYIKYLDKNDTAYNAYFEWKKRGSTRWYHEFDVASPESLLCPIVHKLREVDDRKTGKIKTTSQIVDMENWWKSSCGHRKSVWGN